MIKKIAVVSPSSIVKDEYIKGAEKRLKEWGIDVQVMPHAYGPSCGTYAASFHDRLADFREALEDDSVDCIFCSRGGYGAMQLIGFFDTEKVRRVRKPIVGFSDITALHAVWQKLGVPSLHASMAKLLTEAEDDNPSLLSFRRWLMDGVTDAVAAPWMEDNVSGEAKGILVGGNMALLGAMCGTEYDMLRAYPGEDLLLFLEDIGEPVYRIDRLWQQLRLHPEFRRVKGIMVGNFKDCRGDVNFSSPQEMLAQRVRELGSRIPVAFGFPIGHEGLNMPLRLGISSAISISESGSVLRQ